MKILIIADTYYPDVNGCSYFAQRLAYYKKEKGHEVAVVAPSGTIKHTDENRNNMRVFGVSSLPIFVNNLRLAHPFFIQKQMKKILEKFEPDVIHMQSHFSINKAMFKVAKKKGVPIVATNHFMPENLTHYLPVTKKMTNWANEFMWRDFAKVFNQIPFVTAPTEMAADLIRPRLTIPVTSVTNGIDLETFNPRNNGEVLRKHYNIPKGKPVLMFVGRLDAEKRIHQTIEACAIAMKKVDFSLVIGGKGVQSDNLKKLTEKLGIKDKVFFTGFVSDKDLPNFYAIADCFINACSFELQCLVVMEAMATGLPIIAVNAGALPHLVEDGVNGNLFEPGDISRLTQIITDIMSSEEKRLKMGKESLRMIKAHSIYTMLETYLNIYEKSIKHHHGKN